MNPMTEPTKVCVWSIKTKVGNDYYHTSCRWHEVIQLPVSFFGKPPQPLEAECPKCGGKIVEIVEKEGE